MQLHEQPSLPINEPERLEDLPPALRVMYETHGGPVVKNTYGAVMLIQNELEGLEEFNNVGIGEITDKKDDRYRMHYWIVKGAETGDTYRVFQDGTYEKQ